MEISTTINLFISPDLGDMDACRADFARYSRIGFKHLDAIFCQAGVSGSPLRDDSWQDWARKIREIADSEGVSVIQAHMPAYNFLDTDSGAPADNEMITDRSIAAAAILGAKWIVAHPATMPHAGMMAIESRRANIEYYLRRLDAADKAGIGIAVENMADFEGGGRRRWYCACAEELCDLADALDPTGVRAGICWDFGHANLMYENQTEALRYVGKRLKVTHVHDNSGMGDEHIAPFRGNVDWFGIMRTLAEFYDGDLSFEVRRILRTDVPEVIKDGLWTQLYTTGNFLKSIYDSGRP